MDFNLEMFILSFHYWAKISLGRLVESNIAHMCILSYRGKNNLKRGLLYIWLDCSCGNHWTWLGEFLNLYTSPLWEKRLTFMKNNLQMNSFNSKQSISFLICGGRLTGIQQVNSFTSIPLARVFNLRPCGLAVACRAILSSP